MSEKRNQSSPEGKQRHYKSPTSTQPDKAAEAVATYRHVQRQKGKPRTRSVAGISTPDEVWRFASTHGLVSHLETVVRLVRESFRQVDGLRFTYDVDPEIENEAWITVRAKVKGTTDDLIGEHSIYRRSMVQNIPIDKLPLVRLFIGSS